MGTGIWRQPPRSIPACGLTGASLPRTGAATRPIATRKQLSLARQRLPEDFKPRMGRHQELNAPCVFGPESRNPLYNRPGSGKIMSSLRRLLGPDSVPRQIANARKVAPLQNARNPITAIKFTLNDHCTITYSPNPLFRLTPPRYHRRRAPTRRGGEGITLTEKLQIESNPKIGHPPGRAKD